MSSKRSHVVALVGMSGSGKSVVASRLYEHHGLTRVRFGDPQRDMLKAGFGLTEAEIDGAARTSPVDRFGGHTPYHLVHTLSHAWGRAGIHSDLFVWEWERRIDLIAGSTILSDDLQRPNEANAVRRKGGVLVRITRPGWTPARVTNAKQLDAIQCDVDLINDGSKDDLIAKTDVFAERLREALDKLAA